MKTCFIFLFVFIVMLMVVTLVLGQFGSTVLFVALGLEWSVRIIVTIVISSLIAGKLS